MSVHDEFSIWKKHLKEKAETTNPCHKEHEMSLVCLDHNYYDRSKCEVFFKNYKTCKEFWNYVRKDRKRKGLQPHIPLPADRNRIKAEYIPFFKS